MFYGFHKVDFKINGREDSILLGAASSVASFEKFAADNGIEITAIKELTSEEFRTELGKGFSAKLNTEAKEGSVWAWTQLTEDKFKAGIVYSHKDGYKINTEPHPKGEVVGKTVPQVWVNKGFVEEIPDVQ